MLVTGLGVSEEERLADLQESQVRHCEKQKEYMMEYSAFQFIDLCCCNISDWE